MRKAGQEGVASRRIDNDEIALALQAAQRGQKALALFRFSLVEVALLAGFDAQDFRHRELGASILHPAGAVFEVPGQRALPDIEVDHTDPLSDCQKGHAEMDGNGRLARPALLIADDDDACLSGRLRCVRQTRPAQVRHPVGGHERYSTIFPGSAR